MKVKPKKGANRPKLSIGMIVKNESKNLRKCLTALQPILTRVPSELIIADTGSKDDTVAIAREFTDKVLQIEWTNDFSAARNHTIKAAQGEWYMFMDADEFWEDTEDLVHFFNSGEYRKYNAAMHQRTDELRNGVLKNTNPMRLAKITESLVFKSPIHEYLDAKPPFKNLNSWSLHTGYAFESEEEEKAKHKRNMELMLAAHEKDPSNMHIVAQICLQAMVEDDGIFEKFLTLGFNTVKDKPYHGQFHFFYRRLQHHHLLKNDYESAIAISNEYLRKAPLSVVTIDILVMQGEAYKILKHFKEAAAAYEKAQELFAKMRAGLLDMEPASRDHLLCVNPEFEEINITNLLLVYSELGEFPKFFKLCKKANPLKPGFIEFYLAAIERSAMYKETASAYEHIARQDDAVYQKLLPQFEERLQKTSNPVFFYEAFTGIQSEDFYIKLLQLRAADLRGDCVGVYALLSGFKPLLQPVVDLPYAQGEALFLAFKYNALFTEVAAALDVEIIPAAIAQMKLKVKNFAKSVAEAGAQYENLEKLPNKAALWLQNLSLTALEEPNLESGQKDELFRLFLHFSKSYMNGTYRAENLTAKNITKLPGIYRFTFYAGSERYFDEAKKIAPRLANFLNSTGYRV